MKLYFFGNNLISVLLYIFLYLFENFARPGIPFCLAFIFYLLFGTLLIRIYGFNIFNLQKLMKQPEPNYQEEIALFISDS